MDRQSRLRISGLIFLLVLVFELLATCEGSAFSQSLLSQDLAVSTAQLLVGAALVIFASDSVGYILSSLTVFVFNQRNGYSGQYARALSYSHFPQVLRNEYQDARTSENEEPVHFNFERSWPRFTPEQLLVYFFWHRPEVENRLEAWVERRNTAYFTALSSCMGIVLATITAACWILVGRLHPTPWNGAILALSLGMVAVLAINGLAAMRDGLAAIDLVIAGHINPAIRRVFRDHDPTRVSLPPSKAA